MPWDWETFPEFMDSVERTPKGVNILAYQGLAPLMIYVMGLEVRCCVPGLLAAVCVTPCFNRPGLLLWSGDG